MQKEQIVVRMPNWLGDAVMGTPIVEDIKKDNPQAHLTVLCHSGIKSLLEANPHIDDFIAFSRDKKNSPQEKRRIFEALREKKFDAGLLLTRSFSSAWWFFRGGVKNRIGFNDHFRKFLLTHPQTVPENEEYEHQVITYKKLLLPLGINPSQTSPSLHLLPDEIDQAIKALEGFGILTKEHLVIGVNPGAAFGSAKCWLPERFVELNRRLLQTPHVRLLYFGDATGKPLVDDICSHFGPRVVNLAGKTSLRSFMAYLSICNCLVTNDSGPMHVAAALKTPLVAIFGSTNEIKTGPYASGTIIHKHVACSPCYKRKCPIDFRCMKSITVDDVFNAILQTVPHDSRFS